MPETLYANNGGVHIAYQVVSEGADELLFAPGWFTHVELGWEVPPYARFLERLASFAHLIVMDKRGTGASDRAVASLALEDQVDDTIAVLDAATVERPFIFGTFDGGAVALLCAAAHPGRVRGVIAFGTRARFTVDDNYPWGTTPEWNEAMISMSLEGWRDTTKNVELAREFNPGTDDSALDLGIRWAKRVASPGMVADLMRAYSSIDIRSVLGNVRVPVLVLHRRDDLVSSIDHARYLADQLPDARLVELPGSEFFPNGDLDPIAEEIQEFVTGTRRSADPDRSFATILFTDFVDSTAQSAVAGDRAWRDLLNRHETDARRDIERFRGRLVKHTGDGLVATFDAPGRAVACALSLSDVARRLGIETRTGLHAGEIQLRGDDIAGIAVSIASRVMDRTGSGEIVVSQTIKDLVVGSALDFDDRGEHVLKGVPGSWKLYAVRQ